MDKNRLATVFCYQKTRIPSRQSKIVRPPSEALMVFDIRFMSTQPLQSNLSVSSQPISGMGTFHHSSTSYQVTKVMLANRATEAQLLQSSHPITRKKGTLVIKAIK
jgi:hypothetical protein